MKKVRTEKTQDQTVQAIDSRSAEAATPRLPANPILQNPFFKSGFLRFSYSAQEISSSSAGKTHIHHREYRFEDGKLSSEEFEGTLDGRVYEEAIHNAQNLVMDSMKAHFNLFASMMRPHSSKEDDT